MTGINYEDIREEIVAQDRQRRRRRRRWIVLALLAFFALLTYFEATVFELGELDLPVSGNLLVFIMININILLLVAVVFLVLRSLVELIFERRRRVLGTRLRTKMVISFVSLTLIPTGLLFFVSLQFVSTSIDYWFNINVEHSLVESLDLARDVYRDTRTETVREGEAIAALLQTRRYPYRPDQITQPFLRDTLNSHGLSGIEIIGEERSSLAAVYLPELAAAGVPEVPADLLRQALGGESGLSVIQEVAAGELVRSLTPFTWSGLQQEEKAVLVLSRLIPAERLERMAAISSGLESYRQLMLFQTPIKTSLLVTLLIVTLLIVFCAIWFGFYVASGLTGPIRKLAEATRRVADGDLEFELEKTSGDEMGTLVDSFNRMTRDLLASRRQIEQTAQELDRRRRYTETILQNVAAGVISLDDSGRVITINRFAGELLKVRQEEIVGRHYRAILHREHLKVLEGFLQELARSGKNSIQRPLRLTVEEEVLSLRINFTRLYDEEGRPLGVVLVFDNLSELEKAQRMAAWREVARSIAHEVKNPLTPIQLSAQRLRKKYLERLAGDNEVFDLCTRTIISQVEELQRLVSEFSNFARMPAIAKSLNDLVVMVDDVLVLYREGHKEISFRREGEESVPLLFDPKQMKRVLINLLDNAVAEVPAGQGEIKVLLSHDRERGVAVLEVCDNGPGIKEENKPRLFEPYFSTKKAGTGLGLAIAGTVVTDHGGTIRVRDNQPHGACFVVELPLSGQSEPEEV
ncbi:sensor histidine kinase [Desulfurivibrio alkaliphilus]|uniref:histidine kinase n=1 Tax=Desulfurivibrio alkaliphilus (strain DSM 19089 / UNIQEM U267 / AHT2) TaxID=589865 RepID=D6Z6T8_DESAT|nr:ATP-binding protein [Desulfurivibrio alkaliphilus]ADH85047.1 multi-sensor signal transduction histidine kinase [Desulfurivibrio alkaliphilus AHT 2]